MKKYLEFGFPEFITGILVALKLTNVISWRWMWIVSPLWVRTIILAIILLWIEMRERR